MLILNGAMDSWNSTPYRLLRGELVAMTLTIMVPE